jgi:hypothetical protein
MQDSHTLSRTNSESLYSILPLKEEAEFRLLKVNHQYTEHGFAIRQATFRLSVFNIHDCPPYHTLSYTWGQQTTQHMTTITIDGLEIHITKTLLCALKAISKIQKGQDFLIWADAISINQNNLKERNHQVQLMEEIYRRCESVLIWLGDGFDKSIGEAFSFIKKWKTLLDMHKISKVSPEMLTKQFPLAFDSTEWEKLTPLCYLPWWSRVWTVQELLLPQTATLMYGTETIDFVAFHEFWTKIGSEDLSHWKDEGSMVVRRRHTVKGTPCMLKCRLYSSRTLTNKPLFTILEQFAGMDCSNPRDRVYGVLGLCLQKDNFPIDYAVSIEVIFLETARTILNLDNSLEVLAQAGLSSRPVSSPSEFLQLPTWVPTWNQYRQLLEKFLGFNASGSVSAKFRFSFDHRCLIYQGFKVDKITQLKVLDLYSRIDSAENPQYILIWLFLKGSSRSYPTGKPILEEMFRFLEMNYDQRRKLRYTELDEETKTRALGLIPYIRNLCPNWYEDRRKSGGKRLVWNRIADRFDLPTDSILNELLAQPRHKIASFLQKLMFTDKASTFFTLTPTAELLWHWQNVFNSFHESAFFCTSQGYVGIAKPGIEVGDIVSVAFGCSAPLIVREREDDDFGLIGQCYLQGVMDGEAIDKFNHGLFQSDDFRLV